MAFIALGALLLAIPARIALFQSSLPPETQAAAAVVLGAGFRADGPSPVFAARLDYGLELLRKRRVRQLILTGGVRAGASRSESDVARSYLLQRGAEPTALLLEERSRNTLENLCFARSIAREHALSPLIVVSDPMHLPRALLLAEDIDMPPIKPRPPP